MSDFWINLSMGGEDDFPTDKDLVRGKWAPLYFEPIPGSGERLTIAAIVVGNDGFEIVAANRLSALGCLYPEDVDRLNFFVRAAIDAVREDLSIRGIEVITKPQPPMTGIYFGKARECMGNTLLAIAKSWLSRSSSLMSLQEEIEGRLLQEEIQPIHENFLKRREPDKLPLIVYDRVFHLEPALSINFHPDIRAGRNRTARRRGSTISIDYDGRNIVANFCTLKAANASQAPRIIKPQLWDLTIHRRTTRRSQGISHELLVQRPAPYDTQFTDKQHQSVATALVELELQAQKGGIILRPFTTPEEMVRRVIEAEAA